MFVSSVILVAIAVTLAWPLPMLLDRAGWTFRSPEIALVLWQAIALSGGASMIAGPALFGLDPFGDTPIDAAGGLVRSVVTNHWPAGFTVLHALSLSFAALLFVHLMLNLTMTTVKTTRTRRRHRELLTLLSSPAPGLPSTRIINEDVPLAYCIPGAVQSFTVVSEGLVRRLDDEQLQAVIEHERAHLNQRHTVVLTLFASWASALPWFPIANRALLSVELLIEALADDTAARRIPRRTVSEAIRIVSLHEGGGPEVADRRSARRRRWRPGVASYEVALAIRVRRLVQEPVPLNLFEKGSVAALSAVMVLATVSLIVWPL